MAHTDPLPVFTERYTPIPDTLWWLEGREMVVTAHGQERRALYGGYVNGKLHTLARALLSNITRSR